MPPRRVLAALLLVALLLPVGAQFPKKKKEKAPAVRSDIKCVLRLGAAPACAHAARPAAARYIRCGVCTELAKTLARGVKDLREEKGAKARREASRQSRSAAAAALGGQGTSQASQ